MATRRAGPALEKLHELLDLAGNDAVPVSWAAADLMRKLSVAMSLKRAGMDNDAIFKQLRIWGPQQRTVLGVLRGMRPEVPAKLLHRALELDRRSRTGLGEATGESPTFLRGCGRRGRVKGVQGAGGGGTEGRRDGGTEGRRDGGTEGRRDGGKKGRRDGGKKGRREEGTEGRRDGGKKERSDGGKKRRSEERKKRRRDGGEERKKLRRGRRDEGGGSERETEWKGRWSGGDLDGRDHLFHGRRPTIETMECHLDDDAEHGCAGCGCVFRACGGG